MLGNPWLGPWFFYLNIDFFIGTFSLPPLGYIFGKLLVLAVLALLAVGSSFQKIYNIPWSMDASTESRVFDPSFGSLMTDDFFHSITKFGCIEF